MSVGLTPSLWRTCRVLAHPTRLRLLSEACSHGRASVSELAAAAGMPPNQASMRLRQLASRGLLSVKREGRWAFFSPETDPAVAHAAAMLAAARRAFQRRETTASMIAALTAFTHPRRISIVQVLMTTPLDATDLAGRCRMSLPAAVRHLDKLRRRGVVREDRDGRWGRVCPRVGLLRDLVRTVCQHPG